MITHLRRAFKYFVQIMLLFGVTVAILILTKMASPDVNTAFRHGWKSIEMIVAVFAGLSLIYPFFGYGKRTIKANGEPSAYWEGITEVMDFRGYVPAGETPEGGRKFRLKSTSNRVARLWEDTITINPVLGGFQAEGLNRDLVRVAMALDRKLNSYDD